MNNKEKLYELTYEKISDLREKGYAYLDLIEMDFFTKGKYPKSALFVQFTMQYST